jgi:hypothetical protein
MCCTKKEKRLTVAYARALCANTSLYALPLVPPAEIDWPVLTVAGGDFSGDASGRRRGGGRGGGRAAVTRGVPPPELPRRRQARHRQVSAGALVLSYSCLSVFACVGANGQQSLGAHVIVFSEEECRGSSRPASAWRPPLSTWCRAGHQLMHTADRVCVCM